MDVHYTTHSTYLAILARLTCHVSHACTRGFRPPPARGDRNTYATQPSVSSVRVSFADPVACGCGHSVRVTIPSLRLAHTYTTPLVYTGGSVYVLMYSVQYTNAQLGHGGLNSTTDLPISSTRPWIGFLGYYSADCPHRGPCPFVRKHSLPPMCFFFFFFFFAKVFVPAHGASSVCPLFFESVTWTILSTIYLVAISSQPNRF